MNVGELDPRASRSHSGRNFILFSAKFFILFIVGSNQVFNYLISDRFVPRNTQLGPISIELAVVALVISLIAIPSSYRYILFFRGVVQTRAIRLYLWVMRGKTVITSRASDL